MTRHPGNITSTYRFQFHRDFTFSDLEKLQDYLKELGIDAVYASPVFRSAPGSTHGYDVLDPLRINPELGTETQFAMLVGKLRENGIGWMQDIVPNHMGFHPGNPWLADVLEKGRRSVYASFFDSSWSGNFFRGRIMAPFLGASLEEVIEKEELAVTYSGRRLVFSYYDQQWPLHPLSYAEILQTRDNEFDEDIFSRLPEQIAQMQRVKGAETYALQWNEFLLQLASLVETAGAGPFLSSCLETANNDPERLQRIAGMQTYRLCSWRETNERINFRRFFTINGLICLNMQEQPVFRQYHRLIRSLLEEGLFTGLRVDHIDGLFDPCSYLDQLRELAGDTTSIVVEKILENGEDLPSSWPVQGTSGYEFLALVNNLFTQSSSEDIFTRFYRELIGEERSVQEQVAEKKALILQKHMQGELDNLYAFFRELYDSAGFAGMPGSGLRKPQELREQKEPRELREAIGAFLVHCPVYRFYGNHFPLEEKEAAAVRNVITHARRSHPSLAPSLYHLEEALLERSLEGNEEYNRRALLFYQRCMQFSGPLMAKGVEDTLMYTYNRFIGHNEVGDSPDTFGIVPQAFHQAMKTRLERWPGSLNATSTHDTKRGEDVRARLNVLTSLPREWVKAVRQWQRLNSNLKQNGAPDANDEYFIYQTLTGAWPFHEEEETRFGKRLEEYLVKALREAKRHTSWEKPNEIYEVATRRFAAALLDSKRPFRKHFLAFHKKIRDPARINSLSQVLLKFTCPGVPDTYQGCEGWDLSLVDPDNRRPVDYRQRQQWLHDLTTSPKSQQDLLCELWKDSASARIKLWLTHLLLQERKRCPRPFMQGAYIPIEVKGRYRQHILAFARRHGQTWYLSVIPLHLAELCRRQGKEITDLDWKDTRVILPAEAPREWEHLLDGSRASTEKPDTVAALGGDHMPGGGHAAPWTGHTEPGGEPATPGAGYPASGTGEPLLLKELFSILPMAFLKAEPPATERSAGILMHITSLSSPFGTGDMGPAAREFIGFLGSAGQRYWQVLPLNPVVADQQYSPYSPVSSMAGNTLLISPELLAEDGWLDPDELRQFHLSPAETIDFKKASRVKGQLLEKAWDNFCKTAGPCRERHFRQFCKEEAGWLEDFALYTVLKKQHGDRPWYRWPERYRLRNKTALEEFTAAHEKALDREKWLQFMFSAQWNTLREHGAATGIMLLGDLPFYISYDSADVWSQPGIFSVDKKGRITAAAGVPPDYFNSDGQLWGMPVFRWDILKEQGYSWWVRRIRRNMDWFDLLRLDHFRAFSAYWEVPAGQKTAVNGQWKPGPGADLFRILQKELGALPLVAEDLGDIDEPVYQLRDEFKLPGMKVLQFAFGKDMASSPHAPHQYTPGFIAYTGTHDNNTTRGWYNKELTREGRKRLSAYAGQAVTAKNVHRVLSRLAYASVAETVILPLQDVLGLDERSRMNVPASLKGNWQWRVLPGQLTDQIGRRLLAWVGMYGRGHRL